MKQHVWVNQDAMRCDAMRCDMFHAYLLKGQYSPPLYVHSLQTVPGCYTAVQSQEAMYVRTSTYVACSACCVHKCERLAPLVLLL